MPSVEFVVMGQARPKGSSKAITLKGETMTRVVGANPKTKRWENAVAIVAFQARNGRPLFAGAVTVIVHFHLQRPKSLPKRVTHHLTKPDSDKLCRAVLDGLRGILFRDDSQVTSLHAFKSYAVGEPCTTIAVMENPDAQDEVEQSQARFIHPTHPGVS
jgi:Holliday junction resolvase RusA-like endonuclease